MAEQDLGTVGRAAVEQQTRAALGGGSHRVTSGCQKLAQPRQRCLQLDGGPRDQRPTTSAYAASSTVDRASP